MNEEIIVDHLKCDGCANTITKGLLALEGVTLVNVEVPTSTIKVMHEGKLSRNDFLQKLAKLGYPEQGTGNNFQKMKSYVSCAIGRIN